MKKTKRFCLFMIIILLSSMLISCGEQTPPNAPVAEETKLITVGFSQVGAESDWRRANTESMKEALSKENGFDLVYMDGQQKQTNQIRAIRTFIQKEVDYIVLAPVKEEGFSTVLQEAKDAGIPVIIVDRMVDEKDNALFTCFVGSDFELEGLKMVEWLNSYATSCEVDSANLKIVNVQGTPGSSAQLGRSKGLETGVEKFGWTLLSAEFGDYTQTKGKEVMKGFLESYPDLNVVYCENDNMAFGVIEAVEEAGRNVGTDLKNGDVLVLSFDGVSRTAQTLVKDGKIACIGECNPLHGPRVSAIIRQLEKGEKVDKISYVDESVFSFTDMVKQVEVNGKAYDIMVLGQEKE